MTHAEQDARAVISADAAEARNVVLDEAKRTALSLDEVGDRLEAILAGFNREQKRRDIHRRRIVGALVGVGLLAVVLLGLAVMTVHTQAQQNAWDTKRADHVACMSRADGRSAAKDFSLVLSSKILDDLVAFGSSTNTPAQQQQVVAFVSAEKRSNLKLAEKSLPPINCSKDAPAPEGARPTWPS